MTQNEGREGQGELVDQGFWKENVTQALGHASRLLYDNGAAVEDVNIVTCHGQPKSSDHTMSIPN